MKENEIARLILCYLSGRMTPEDEAALQQWRAESPSNEKIFRETVATGHLEEEYIKTSSVDTSRPMDDMRRRIRKSRSLSLGRWVVSVAGAAAILLLGIWIGVKVKSDSTHPAASHPEELVAQIQPGQTKAVLTTSDGEVFNFSEPQKATSVASHKRAEARINLNSLEIPRGGEFHIVLEDSTEVWLNAQTTLRYPEVFSDSMRVVEIAGEGYFKVAKEQKRPFIVKTANQTIRVYGTEFNVNSYEDDEEVVTTLVSGSIALTSDLHSSNELLLAPGHQAVFNKSNDETAVKSVNTEVVTSWRNDMFVFDDLSLDKIMRQLSRWYDFEYEFLDEASSKIVFKGRIPRYGKFGNALSILEISGGLRFDVEGKKVFISQSGRNQ